MNIKNDRFVSRWNIDSFFKLNFANKFAVDS